VASVPRGEHCGIDGSPADAQYAKRLLLVSHAALHLMPYLPEGEDVQVFTPERILAEHRAKNIIEGGDGGWKVGMTDDADAVAELAKRDGDEVAAWGMVHARQVAQEKLKEAERLTREPAARERRERLRLNRERAKEERARAKAAADELADVAKESEGQGAGQ